MGQPEKSKADIAAEWEAKLAAQGLAEDVGEDKGAQALREHLGESGEKAVDEGSIVKAIQEYFAHRKGLVHGAHLQAAGEIARRAGVKPDDVPVDLIESVREDMRQFEEAVSRIAQELRTTRSLLAHDARRLSKAVKAQLAQRHRGEFNDIDRGVKTDIILRIAKLQTGDM